MRELALITLRIVDETTRLQAEEMDGLYTPDYPGSVVAKEHLDKRTVGEPEIGMADQFVYCPLAEMSVMRVEPCNPDSALGLLLVTNEIAFVSSCINRLGHVGLKLLDQENDARSKLHAMSKTLGGDGVDRTDMVQFYAVFDVSANGDEVFADLEGVLRLDKIDMAIDEAILL